MTIVINNSVFCSLQDRYLTKERAMKDAAAKVFQLQSGISSLKNKVADTERQLPALEEAKKAAVSGESNSLLVGRGIYLMMFG